METKEVSMEMEKNMMIRMKEKISMVVITVVAETMILEITMHNKFYKLQMDPLKGGSFGRIGYGSTRF